MYISIEYIYIRQQWQEETKCVASARCTDHPDSRDADYELVSGRTWVDGPTNEHPPQLFQPLTLPKQSLRSSSYYIQMDIITDLWAFAKVDV